MNGLSEFCIYTIRHSADLAAQMKSTSQNVLDERRPWTTGRLLWNRARRKGAPMPIVFSAADIEGGLICWAIIDDITIDDEAGTTKCRYSSLKPISSERPKSSLRLRAGGRPLSDDYIRPYALCYTPDFLI